MISAAIDKPEARADALLFRWTEAAAEDRAVVLSALATEARTANTPHPPTTPGSRLATWLRQEAWFWPIEQPSSPPEPFLVTPKSLRTSPAEQLVAAILLLTAVHTGQLPPMPARCGTCGTDVGLTLHVEIQDSHPGLHQFLCQQCRRQSSQQYVPPKVDVLLRRLEAKRVQGQASTSF
ncbi:hypothetical protein [Streptomyces smyrnaeus]|uniref:hypothetical protein n=1 Tax=Streptomyces smyrnaeus TaxID=1387713 RepID=UPI00117C347B